MAAAADMPGGGITLAHVVELVLIVAVTTNWMQYAWHRCSCRPASWKGGHFVRFAPFYTALLATPLLCFPKGDVVVGDLLKNTRDFTYQPGPKQESAFAGSVTILLSVALLILKPGAPASGSDSKKTALLS